MNVPIIIISPFERRLFDIDDVFIGGYTTDFVITYVSRIKPKDQGVRIYASPIGGGGRYRFVIFVD